MKKALAILLAVLMLLAMFAGCSSDKKAETKTETKTEEKKEEKKEETVEYDWEYQMDTSPFEFDVWWPSVWSWAKAGLDSGWDDSPVYQYITEKTGGKMNVEIPLGDEGELAGTMIAAGTYPDVCVFGSFTSPYIVQMKDANLIYSWTELINEHAPKMQTLIPDSMMASHADENGELWYYPGFAYHETWAEEAEAMGAHPAGGAHGTNVIFCRKDTLEAFGKDDISDIDTFTEYLYFCRDNYPDVDPVRLFASNPRNGGEAIFTHLKATFGCHLSDTYPQADGSIKYYMYDPAYIDYLSWLNKLYKDGVISSNQLTDDQTALDTKTYSAGYGAINSATYTAYNTLETTLKESFGADTDKLYVAVGPINGNNGIKWQTYKLRSTGGQSSVITKNCDIPERVIRFFEFIFTDEGQMTIQGGIEGEHWTRNADGTISHDEAKASLANSDLEGFVTKYKLCGNWSPWCNTSYWEGLLGACLTPPGRDLDESEKRLQPYTIDLWADGFCEITACIEGGSDLDVIRTKVNEACMNAAMKMIASANEAEFNKILADCITEIEGLGVAQIEEAYTAEYKSCCESLGITPGASVK
ncbi:MAG: hypothetical protein GX633_10385 [Clostridiales bacterium]|nr:hypothetical protein [Clostridiales bacterium]